MPSRIASVLGFSPPSDSGGLVRRHELGRLFGVPQSQALGLMHRPDFPQPTAYLHRRVPGETLPQPQPVWERAELERWLKELSATW